MWGWILGFFGSILGWLISAIWAPLKGFFGRASTFLGTAAVWTVLTLAYFGAVLILTAAIIQYTPDVLTQAWQFAMPDNSAACINAVFTTRIFTWVYLYKVRLAKEAMDLSDRMRSWR